MEILYGSWEMYKVMWKEIEEQLIVSLESVVQKDGY